MYIHFQYPLPFFFNFLWGRKRLQWSCLWDRKRKQHPVKSGKITEEAKQTFAATLCLKCSASQAKGAACTLGAVVTTLAHGALSLPGSVPSVVAAEVSKAGPLPFTGERVSNWVVSERIGLESRCPSHSCRIS